MRKSLTLAQLAMMFNGCNAKFYCIGRDVFELDWLADFVFKVGDRARLKKFVHCPERPSDEDCSFYLGFEVEEGKEEFFFIRGDNNDVLTDFCDIFVEYAIQIRAFNWVISKKPSQAIQNCLADTFILDSPEVWQPNARTEIVYKESADSEYPIFSFEEAISIPFDLVEQRRVASDDKEYNWGCDTEHLSNNRKQEIPLSRIVARYLDPVGIADPIEVPLRVDSSYLPAWLFDHVLVSGIGDNAQLEDDEESESSDESKE